MKAPEKIYLPRFVYEKWIYQTSDQDDITQVEYIRKDIVDETIKTAEDHAYFAGQEKFREKLIEWVKEKLEDLKDLLDTDPYKEGYVGQCEAFKELMDKLNSIM